MALIEIDGLPSYKMVDLSMANCECHNQRVSTSGCRGNFEASQARANAVEPPPTLSQGSELSPETLEKYFQVAIPMAFQQGKSVDIPSVCAIFQGPLDINNTFHEFK